MLSSETTPECRPFVGLFVVGWGKPGDAVSAVMLIYNGDDFTKIANYE